MTQNDPLTDPYMHFTEACRRYIVTNEAVTTDEYLELAKLALEATSFRPLADEEIAGVMTDIWLQSENGLSDIAREIGDLFSYLEVGDRLDHDPEGKRDLIRRLLSTTISD